MLSWCVRMRLWGGVRRGLDKIDGEFVQRVDLLEREILGVVLME